MVERQREREREYENGILFFFSLSLGHTHSFSSKRFLFVDYREREENGVGGFCGRERGRWRVTCVFLLKGVVVGWNYHNRWNCIEKILKEAITMDVIDNYLNLYIITLFNACVECEARICHRSIEILAFFFFFLKVLFDEDLLLKIP